jgi:hypothetical protein
MKKDKLTKKKSKKNKDLALSAAVSALYFTDNSDYENALHKVVKHLTNSDKYLNHDQIIKLFNSIDHD